MNDILRIYILFDFKMLKTNNNIKKEKIKNQNINKTKI